MMFKLITQSIAIIMFFISVVGVIGLPDDLEKWLKIAAKIEKNNLIIALLITSCILFIFSIFKNKLFSYFSKRQADRPIISCKPANYELQLTWGDKQILPHASGREPFLLLLKNIGIGDALDITIEYQIVGVDIEQILNETKAFPEHSIQDKIIKLPLQTGATWTTESFKANNNAYEKLEILKGSDEITISFPNSIKYLFSVYFLCRSSQLGSTKLKSLETENKKLEKLFENNTPSLAWDEYWKEKQREQIIKSPILKIKITYSDRNGNKESCSFNIRCIYMVTSHSFWANYGKSAMFHGGFGILSFENLNKSEEGFYNSMEDNLN